MKKKTNKLSPRVAEALGAIKSVFELRDDDSRVLWDILSALRGPDSGEYWLKKSMTAVIRHKAFGGTFLVGAISNQDSAENALTRRKCDDRGLHFENHAQRAFNALGLSWDRVNKPKKSCN